MRLDWRQVLASLLIGLVLGSALGRWTHWGCRGRWDDGKGYGRMVERFSRKLDLSPEQTARLEAILETKRLKMKALRTEVQPRFEEIRASAKDEIRGILSPEQLPRFEKL
ncbi:MAG: hypothetical protein AAB412_06785, partial [Elusimicrobiota bacterium]